MNGTVRKLGVSLVATSVTLASLVRPVAVDSVSIETRKLFDPERIERFEFRQAEKRLFREAESCFRDGRWDLGRMVPLCDEYYGRMLPRFRRFMVARNGVPMSLVEALPLIADVADRYGVDPDVLAAIAYKESYGFKYAVHINDDRAIPEIAVGLGQINVAVAGLTRYEYRHIFDERVNLGLSARQLRGCLDRYHNVEQALYAYNHGLYARNTPRMADRDPYVRAVTGYVALIRQDGQAARAPARILRRGQRPGGSASGIRDRATPAAPAGEGRGR